MTDKPVAVRSFPVRAYIQTFDEVPPDYQLVADELKKRSIPVVFKTTEDIVLYDKRWAPTRDDLVVGNFDWTRLSLERMKIPMPTPVRFELVLPCLSSFNRGWCSRIILLVCASCCSAKCGRRRSAMCRSGCRQTRTRTSQLFFCARCKLTRSLAQVGVHQASSDGEGVRSDCRAERQHDRHAAQRHGGSLAAVSLPYRSLG